MTPRVPTTIAAVGAALALAVPAAWGSEPYRDHGDATDAKLVPVSSPLVVIRDHGDATDAKLVPVSSPLVVIRDHGDATDAKLVPVSSPLVVVRDHGDAVEAQRTFVQSQGVADRVAHTRVVATPSEPQWLTALKARSEGLNRIYRIGEYAPTPSVSTEPAEQRALRLRSEALNRQYRLGEYSVGRSGSINREIGSPPAAASTVSSGSEIDWPALGIGLGVGMVIVFALFLTVRHSRHPVAHG